MRDRKLTGPWAGFAFKGGKLVSPEGNEFGPDDLTWLALTVAIKHEWQTMMAEDRANAPLRRPGKLAYFRDGVRARMAHKRVCVERDRAALHRAPAGRRALR